MSTTRLNAGKGPEITKPHWSEQAMPTSEEWLEWFELQSREAQLAIVTYHLMVEESLSELLSKTEEISHQMGRGPA